VLAVAMAMAMLRDPAVVMGPPVASAVKALPFATWEMCLATTSMPRVMLVSAKGYSKGDAFKILDATQNQKSNGQAYRSEKQWKHETMRL